MAICDTCGHRPVCGKFQATGGHVKSCEHHMKDVVHCKDCEHWHEETGWCTKHSHFIGFDGMACHPSQSSEWKMFDAFDFCSEGERRAYDG